MRPLTSDRAESIRDVAILGDFLLLNFSMLAVYFLLKMVNVPAVTFPFKIYLVVSNLCYVPCISIFKVILHYRIVRPEQIVGRFARNCDFAYRSVFNSAGFNKSWKFFPYLSFVFLSVVPAFTRRLEIDSKTYSETCSQTWKKCTHGCTGRWR